VGEAPIEQIGASLLFQPAKTTNFEMLEHTAQQTIEGDGATPQIQDRLLAYILS